jgi:hypothetical protein
MRKRKESWWMKVGIFDNLKIENGDHAGYKLQIIQVAIT